MVGPRGAAALACLLLSALVAVALPTTANHPQSVPGANVTFDHLKGNEWWVEVKVTANAPVDSVDARVAGRYAGTFTTNSPVDGRLRLNEWGAWVGSFHIPAGSRVEFLAYQNGGMSAVWQAASCPFTHPAGVEQCGTTSSSSSSSTTGGAFDAPFTGVRGNEWWVQAKVGTNGPAIAKVDVRIAPDGAWKPLAKQSWNTVPASWAASYHFPQGSVLQLRATASTGATDLSSCRQWIPPSGQDAAIVPCPGTSTTTTSGPPPFDATFTGVKGNHWWIQVGVSGNQPIAKVEARLDCEPGAWFQLANQGWGYAISIRVNEGQRVDFRATSTSGATDRSGGYTWTAATPAPACPATWPPPSSGFEVRYSDPKGPANHVEITAAANRPLASVEARTGDSLLWHPLAKTASGAWAADFDVTDHNYIEFRATATDGSVHVSPMGWIWPTDHPYSDPAPREIPGPGPGDNIMFTSFRGDAHEVTLNTYSVYPLTQVEVSIGFEGPWHAMAMDPHSGDWSVGGLDIPYGSDLYFRASNLLATGVVGTEWEAGGEGPWPPWPQMGSHYSYREVGVQSGTDDETLVHYDTTWETFIEVETSTGSSFDWTGTCTVVVESFATPPGQPGHWENSTETYDFSPQDHPGGWEGAEVGEDSYLWYPSSCATLGDETMPVCEHAAHTTDTESGGEFTVDALRACRHFDDPAQHTDFWYDTRLGLLLDWHILEGPSEHGGWQREVFGELVDTDAPLTVP